jgi:predicted transposase/invertase (TIGR01784 family)
LSAGTQKKCRIAGEYERDRLVKTDSIFFRVFQTLPSILFELLGESPELSKHYDFQSVEVKQTAFRIDGVFVPTSKSVDQTVIFAEVQFQKDEYLYDRMFAEIGMYLAQNRGTVDWKAVVIFPRRSLEPKDQWRHRTMLQGEQFTAIYLEDLLTIRSESLGVQILQLIVAKPKKSEPYLQNIVNQLSNRTDSENQAIIELVSTVMVYKFPELSHEVIEAMFSVSELKQTRVYRDAMDEGRAEEAQTLVMRQLVRRVDVVPSSAEARIRALSLSQVENLAEALLDFSSVDDLEMWLRSQSVVESEAHSDWQ